MYDNTDERGEDAVARQRGGSERPQHVDTCRVYNCYGCEEIVDEPGHLPEVQRWTAFESMGGLFQGMYKRPTGKYVTYTDHVAALRACEARVREEEDRMVPIIRRNEYQRGLSAARDAVAGIQDADCTCFDCERVREALAAIDALMKEEK